MAEENRATLAQLLEEDRDQVVSRLKGDRTSASAKKVLEKETDRLMYRAAQATPDGSRSQAVQGILQVVRNALPFLESVSDAEAWEKQSADAGQKHGAGMLPAVLTMLAGAACVILGLLMQAMARRGLSPAALVISAAGAAAAVLGGLLAGRRKGGAVKKKAEMTHTFLVDPLQVWNVMQGIMLSADHSLEEAEELERLASAAGRTPGQGGLQKQEIAFFSELLENAYAMRRQFPDDTAMREQVESIRYYLHGRGIETEDYSPQSAKWFEILPSGGGSATIRPAMVHDGALLCKGLAAL